MRSASELLAEYHSQMSRIDIYRAEVEAELAKPNPQITQNGVMILEGEPAREVLRNALMAASIMDGLGSQLVRMFGH